MKDLIIIVIIITLVFGGGYLSEKFLEESEKELIDLLEEIHSQIKIGDMTHVDSVYRLQQRWEESKPKWHILAKHQDIDDIEAGLYRFIKAYELGDNKEASFLIVEVMFRINDMHKGEKLELVNIL